MIKMLSGDILTSTTEAIVNPVNCVGVMGAGLALKFAKKYPDMLKPYRNYCQSKQFRPGMLFVYPTPGPTKPNWVVNLPTKHHWKDPSRIQYISCGLQTLIRWAELHEIGSISLPALGCGLGGLSWEEVGPVIDRELQKAPDLLVELYMPWQHAPRRGDW